MASEINTNTPYNVDSDDRVGRFALQSTPEEWFNLDTVENAGGSDGTVPYEDEIAHTPQGDFVVLTRNKENQVIPISASRDLRNEFERLKATKIFDNAEAFAFNRNVNILYFDNDRMTVKISPERIFSSDCKYWSIRGGNVDRVFDSDGNLVESAAPIYYTGILKSDGSGDVLTHLVSTTEVLDPDGNIVMGVNCEGHLIEKMVHGSNYMVQFYNGEMILIDQIPFQGYSVRNMTHDVPPEQAIVDIRAYAPSRNSAGLSENFNLYVGESWHDLGLRLELIYADGSARDVTSEWSTNGSSTGRVRVSGLEDIDTSSVTNTENGDDPQSFTVSYRLTTSDVSPAANAMVEPEEMIISHTYQIYIIPNQYDEPIKLIPAAWMEANGTSTLKTLNVKLYTLNGFGSSKANTVLCDQTYRVRSQVNGSFDTTWPNFAYIGDTPNKLKFVHNGNTVGSIQTSINIPYESDTKTFKINMIIPDSGAINDGVAYDVKEGNVSPSAVAGNIQYLDLFNDTSTGKSKLYFRLVNGVTAPNKILEFKNKYNYTPTNTTEPILPTHIRIRSAKDPSIWNVSRSVPLDSALFDSGITFDTFEDRDSVLVAGSPVLVEFLHEEVDITGVLNSKLVGFDVFYIQENRL